MITDEMLVLAALAVPSAGSAAILLCGRWPNLREAATLATATLLLFCVLALLPTVLAGGRPGVHLFELLPGLPIAFSVEPLGMLFALVASSLWIVNSLYSIGYMRGNGEQHQTRFYICFALSIAAAIGIAFSANMFTLFVFYELLTLITYPLVTHHGTDKARAGGRIYLGLLIGTSVVLLLPALVFTWHVAGTTDFTPGGILQGRLSDIALGGLLALYVFGIGKAALMPFHRWLPAAMVAPTPVSALLHAVAVVKTGVFSVVKIIVYIFGAETLIEQGGADWLTAVAGFTIVAASIVALRADNLKRRLAYSTVSQLSYVVLAAALLTPYSLAAAVLHIAAHAVGKITLFFAAGAIYTAAHKTNVSELDGIGRRMPWTMAAFTIGALSMIGLPPAAGFISKWYLLSGAMAAEQWAIVAVLLASTLLTAGYFMPIVYRAFFRAPVDDGHEHGHAHGEAPLPMVAALTVTAAGTLALFFFPDVPLALARQMLGG
ncbi:MAG: Multiple resistance and pH homeostasis protein A [Candidatus Accumulibacter appositus]|uniref:Multiple resistance and pH homeostasis protein A n=1 Tax=Candidatus Accumulibacter appositus TaxID=1454003 RepID=A0A011QMR2_9PROT|nr:monovalent cation/H+ antiporter subunit D family protein [Accumulibacter sp.]EXI80159.1 MAG: Multiple resistance and pH homeostasis protein A [Candidatus Accumulibacter appositus]HRF03606.1 monovalent cation/H+ antiporter subunit D family protein [Accumulibacter sp.]